MGMGIKLKALGLGLLVALATAGFAVVSASAEVKGHFESDVEHTIVVGTETGAPHDLVFREHVGESTGLTCTHVHYAGTVIPKTTQSVTVTPVYTNCATPSGVWGSTKVDVNGCGFIVYSHGTNTHGTVTIHCPVGKAIEITHPNCTTKVPEQHPSGETLKDGITYTTTTEGGKHTITADVTITTITTHYEGGICVFLGTKHEFNLEGSVTVEGIDTAGNRVNITHT